MQTAGHRRCMSGCWTTVFTSTRTWFHGRQMASIVASELRLLASKYKLDFRKPFRPHSSAPLNCGHRGAERPESKVRVAQHFGAAF